MNWTLDKTKPICPQICSKICLAIVSGVFSAGEKLLSVREVAILAGVNPNTVQKSFDELEKHGVIHSVPCSGWYVNESIDAATRVVEELRIEKSREYITAMSHLGCDADGIAKYLNKLKEENI
ncbi:MAG: GntR family transcriptional regulator [Clostridia bacterium]|nr:GntR family transcriptional regulator [Clostridia bacterium]